MAALPPKEPANISRMTSLHTTRSMDGPQHVCRYRRQMESGEYHGWQCPAFCVPAPLRLVAPWQTRAVLCDVCKRPCIFRVAGRSAWTPPRPCYSSPLGVGIVNFFRLPRVTMPLISDVGRPSEPRQPTRNAFIVMKCLYRSAADIMADLTVRDKAISARTQIMKLFFRADRSCHWYKL